MTDHDSAIHAELLLYAKKYPESTYKPGELLIAAETIPSGIFILTTGEVTQVRTLETGDRLTVNYYHYPAFFPMIWVFTNPSLSSSKIRYDFIAVTSVTGYWIPIDDLMCWLPQNPLVLMDLTARLCRGFDATLAKWEEAHHAPATSLIAHIILRHALRLGVTQPDGRTKVRLTHQEIADQAGLTRETTSRVLGELSRTNILTTGYRSIYIRNIESLTAWLEKA